MKQLASLLAAALLAPASAFSFAHTWYIQEVYTNTSGSVQFVEFFADTLGYNTEWFLNGYGVNFRINDVPVNTMTFSNASATDGSGDLPFIDSLGKTFLIGTANLQTLYGVTPDYIIPANFLAQGALNSVDFNINGNAVNLTNLPTNGVGSLDGLVDNFGTTAADTAVNAQASPKNYAGQTAIIPEPGTAGCMIVGAGALGALAFVRRRYRRG